jgi:hypothetical protein
MNLFKLVRAIFSRKPKQPTRKVADARIEADPFLAALFARLGERYSLGSDGAQILRRTGRARFNPMPVWIKAQVVSCDYEVRAPSQEAIPQARELLNSRYSSPLAAVGLQQVSEKTEDWAGAVLVRRYEGRCESVDQAASAIRWICEDSETQLNLSAE